MASLRFPWIWWGCGWLLLAFVCLGSLMPIQHEMRVFMSDKLVHAAAYATLMLWFSGLFVRDRTLATVAISLFLLGFVLDYLQGAMSTRTFDLWDVAANGGGILVAWALARIMLAGWCERVEKFLTV